MGLKRFFWIAFSTVLLIVSPPFRLNFPLPFALSPVVAQTSDIRKAEAERLFQQGVQQFQTSQFQAALQSWQQVLIIYREIKNRQGEGLVLVNLGSAYSNLGEYIKTIEYYQQALLIAREIKDRKNEGMALGSLGAAYNNLGDYIKAIEYEKQWLAIAQEIRDRQSEGSALGNLGSSYSALGDYSKAMEYHLRSLAIRREITDRFGEGVALGNLGNSYAALGEYPKAIEYYQQSLAIAQQIQDRQGEGMALGNLGTAYQILGENPKAIKYYQQSLAIAQQIQDPRSEGMALGNLGISNRNLGNYLKAIEYSQQQLNIARVIRDRQGEGVALGNLGAAYLYLGDYTKGIEYSQQQLALAQEIKDRQGEGSALGNLGAAYLYLGDYPKAIEYFQQQLALTREIKDRKGEASALNNLGSAYRILGNYPKAIEYHQQSLAIAREIKDRKGEASALNNLGSTYVYTYVYGSHFSKSIDYHQQSLAIAREIKDRGGESAALGNLGAAYLYSGNYPKGIEYSQQQLALAREIRDRRSEGVALGNLGAAYLSLEDYPKAIDFSQQQLDIAQEIKDRENEAYALNNLGFAFYKSGDFKAAENNFIQSINVLESLRSSRLDDTNKIYIVDTQRRTYISLQQVLIAQNKPDVALEISERGRVRAFVELLATKLSSPNDKSFTTPPNLERIKQIAKATNGTIVEYSLINKPFKIKDELQIQQSDIYIWVIKPTGDVIFRSSDLTPLRQQQNTSLASLVNTTRNSIGVNNRSIFKAEVVNPVDEENPTKSLQQLHQLLIAPIADLLPTDPNQRVIFVPQNELFLVPFAALQDQEGKYLIEKHTILTTPSIQVLELTHQQREKVKQAGAKDAIILGNPTMPSVPPEIGEKPQQLASLPGAKREAESIAPLLNTKALTGNEATKAAILARLPQARIVHFATHGLFDDFQGLQSAIALAPTSSDNGLLTASEILDLKLNADLVVLSACNTGRGRITGDGVIGLSRSLFIAGTPSVIVSLWSVPDAPTASLMSEFYTNLYQKKLDKAQALRQAMLKMMEKYRDNPRAWAAFTLIGETE